MLRSALRIAALASVGGLGIFSASAADLGIQQETIVAEAVPVNFDWGGAYIGATGGYAWGKSDYLHITTDWFDFAGGTYSNDVSGLQGGLILGYNIQANNIVFGVEGQILASGVRGGKDYTQYSNSQTTILNWLGTLTGRLGFAANDWLFYGKGGYAAGSVTAENLYYINPIHAWSVTNVHHGWTAGGGVEKAFGNNLVLGVEYAYTNLGTVQNNAPDSAGTPTNIENDLITQSVMGRISLKY